MRFYPEIIFCSLPRLNEINPPQKTPMNLITRNYLHLHQVYVQALYEPGKNHLYTGFFQYYVGAINFALIYWL
jgi:hypothetical protein